MKKTVRELEIDKNLIEIGKLEREIFRKEFTNVEIRQKIEALKARNRNLILQK